ncbi:hypothetical protein LY90DRAFT_700035 [Neocallimastix californiae]|jgi:hypothetical protein|uniref:Uncharacterized protein n=1 Tax=Neocallimastix californiae TaxID=1754190 RepID=A0A1Y2ELC7_9FUNG|nr:hypothetical protein LY90DRAFT_700035 [Neocallimastix californiae]|eukprot:ORY72308.1 hypothetical protein LY90DRAFT_700035 [Neocallimastix californiae]
MDNNISIEESNNNEKNNDDDKLTFNITLKSGEEFKDELQKNIEQYKFEFEKRLYSVLNKDIFNSSFDNKKKIFDTNGNFVTFSEKKNGQNQKSKRKSKYNLNNPFIFSASNFNLDYNQNLGSNRLKFKSENNISDYHKRNNNNQTQYLSKSYNNISNNNRPERSLYDLSGKKVTRNKKDSKIRKTFEDLQKELNNLENDLKNNNNESDEDKIIDLRKKELHKNYKEYIKSKPNNDSPNLRRYKKYVNDFEWAKKRHLEAINKQNTQKTTTEIDEITERLYNPEYYPNVYKMKFNAAKSNEKLDSNFNKKKSSSKKKLNTSNNGKVYSHSEPNLSSNNDYTRAKMIDQINNFSPLSPENFTMKSSKTKKIYSKSLNALNDNISNSHDNIKKSIMNMKNNNINSINNSSNNIQENTINKSQRNISNGKVNRVGFSTEEIHYESTKSSENIKNSLRNISNSSKNLSSKTDLNKSNNNLKSSKNDSRSYSSLRGSKNESKSYSSLRGSKNESKSYSSLRGSKNESKSYSSLRGSKNESKSHSNLKSKTIKQEHNMKNEKINRSLDSITKSKRNKKYYDTEEDTEMNDLEDYEESNSFDIEDDDIGEQAALQFQQIMSFSSKSINNLNNYDN